MVGLKTIKATERAIRSSLTASRLALNDGFEPFFFSAERTAVSDERTARSVVVQNDG
jgi:hypothetical protein